MPPKKKPASRSRSRSGSRKTAKARAAAAAAARRRRTSSKKRGRGSRKTGRPVTKACSVKRKAACNRTRGRCKWDGSCFDPKKRAAAAAGDDADAELLAAGGGDDDDEPLAAVTVAEMKELVGASFRRVVAGNIDVDKWVRQSYNTSEAAHRGRAAESSDAEAPSSAFAKDLQIQGGVEQKPMSTTWWWMDDETAASAAAQLSDTFRVAAANTAYLELMTTDGADDTMKYFTRVTAFGKEDSRYAMRVIPDTVAYSVPAWSRDKQLLHELRFMNESGVRVPWMYATWTDGSNYYFLMQNMRGSLKSRSLLPLSTTAGRETHIWTSADLHSLSAAVRNQFDQNRTLSAKSRVLLHTELTPSTIYWSGPEHQPTWYFGGMSAAMMFHQPQKLAGNQYNTMTPEHAQWRADNISGGKFKMPAEIGVKMVDNPPRPQLMYNLHVQMLISRMMLIDYDSVVLTTAPASASALTAKSTMLLNSWLPGIVNGRKADANDIFDMWQPEFEHEYIVPDERELNEMLVRKW